MNVLILRQYESNSSKRKFREEGSVAVLYGNSPKTSPIKLSGQLIEKIISSCNLQQLSQSNFTHFKEILNSRYDIDISYFSLYRILTEDGLKVLRKDINENKMHPCREKTVEGMMLPLSLGLVVM